MVDEALYEYMRLQLELTTSSFHRYLYERVNWTSRMIAITGSATPSMMSSMEDPEKITLMSG